MDEKRLEDLLVKVSKGQCNVGEALAALKHFPGEMLSCAHVDHHRRLRTGMPEVVFGENKSAEQMIDILQGLMRQSEVVMATRVDRAKAAIICEKLEGLEYHDSARMLTSGFAGSVAAKYQGLIVVVSAGTSDIPVADEAAVTARCLGHRVHKLYDVGVAGIHRLLGQRDILEQATVLIVVAGMEGALPSVVGGLVDKPIIAVPTSVGYGTGIGGIAALLGMLNSCAPGLSVVNIDNGFGAGCAAAAINRQVG
ncbi:MAG: nickel pincer cofactor biosynthesis protein LarB [Desulfobulbaceae bacterium]|nr:nickel pincer cofactor biosynthesis protein LarB [Desulfobulbaceae bacterium]HIJ79953.1 nickel pincer cofactor biosynthesis protein LarB [Deltaproteobacteria bacterium]